MITSTKRNLNNNERQQQIRLLPSIYKRVEAFTLKLIMIVIVLDIPLLVYDHYSSVSSYIQGIYCILIVILAIIITCVITLKYEGGFSNNKQIDIINSMQVEEFKVKTTRAIKREDFEDFGIAFYIDVNDSGIQKTLYLWGQYLYELEDFPNTEFEIIIIIGSGEIIDLKTSGKYFKEEKTLPAFDIGKWKDGDYPENGQLLDLRIDEIK